MRAQAEAGPNVKMNVGAKAGKANDFDGRRDNWHDWALQLKRHIDGIHADVVEFMEWAAARNGESKTKDLKLHRNPGAQAISKATNYLVA